MATIPQFIPTDKGLQYNPAFYAQPGAPALPAGASLAPTATPTGKQHNPPPAAPPPKAAAPTPTELARARQFARTEPARQATAAAPTVAAPLSAADRGLADQAAASARDEAAGLVPTVRAPTTTAPTTTANLSLAERLALDPADPNGPLSRAFNSPEVVAEIEERELAEEDARINATNLLNSGRSVNTNSAATPPVVVPPYVAPPKIPIGDTTVAGQLNTLLDKDSPLLTAARTRGLQFANRRGLLNSSIAAQAAEAAALNVAVPIASADANTAFQREFQGTGIEGQSRIQSEGSVQQGGLLAQDITGRSAIQAEGSAQQGGLLAQDIAGRSALQAEALTSQERISTAEIGSKERLSEAAIRSQETINALRLTSFDLQQAQQAIAQFDRSYQDSFSAISSNENIPADARDKLLEHLLVVRDGNFSIVEQLYSVELDFPTASSAPADQPAASAPASEPVPVPVPASSLDVNEGF